MQKFVCFLILIISFSATANAQDDDAIWFEMYEQIDYHELRNLIEEDKIDSARVLRDGWWVTIKTKEGEFFDTKVTPQTPIADHLYEAGIPVKFEHWGDDDEDNKIPKWQQIFLSILPLLIFIVFFIFILWWSQKRGRKVEDECLDRAKAINDEFLDRQQKQFETFIEDFSCLLKKKESDG